MNTAQTSTGNPVRMTNCDILTNAQRQQARAILEAWVRWLSKQNDPGCGYPRMEPFARGMPVIWEIPDSPILTKDDCERIMLIVRELAKEIQKAILVRYHYDDKAPRRGGLRAQAQYLGIRLATLRDRLAEAEESIIYGLRQ